MPWSLSFDFSYLSLSASALFSFREIWSLMIPVLSAKMETGSYETAAGSLYLPSVKISEICPNSLSQYWMRASLIWRIFGPSLSPIVGSSGIAIFLKLFTPAGVAGSLPSPDLELWAMLSSQS